MKRILSLFLFAISIFVWGCANPGGGSGNSVSDPQNPVEDPQDPIVNPGNEDPIEDPQDPITNPEDPIDNPQDPVDPVDPPVVTGLDLFNSILANPSADYEVYMLETNNLTGVFCSLDPIETLTVYSDVTVGLLLRAKTKNGDGNPLVFKISNNSISYVIGPDALGWKPLDLGSIQGNGNDATWVQYMAVEFSVIAGNLRIRIHDSRNGDTAISVRVRMPN